MLRTRRTPLLVAALAGLSLAACSPPPTPPAPPPPTVGFAQTGQTVVENVGKVSVSLVLSAAAKAAVSVPFTVGGTATSDDFTLAAGTVTFPAGSTTATLEVPITDDSTYEPADETVLITLGQPTGATLGAARAFALTIHDDDPRPVVGFPTGTVRLPENAGAVTVEASLTNPSAEQITVHANIGGTATAANDDLADATWVFAPGQTKAELDFHLKDDGMRAQAKTLVLTLQAPANAGLADGATYTLTIEDVDPAPTLAFVESARTVSESDGTVTIPVKLSAPTEFPVSAFVQVGGTAVAGTDFEASTSVLNISPLTTDGSLTLSLVNDVFHEDVRTIVLTLAGTPDGATYGDPASETVTIADDDDAAQLRSNVFRLSAKSLALADGAPVTTWKDQGPRGLDASAPSTAAQPTFVAATTGSHAAVHFSGLQQLQTAPVQLFPTSASPLTVVAVVRSSAPGEGTLLRQDTTDPCQGFGFLRDGGNTEFGVSSGCADGTRGVNGLRPGAVFQLATVVLKGSGNGPGNVALYRNGLALNLSMDGNGYPAAGSYPTASAALQIGARTAGGSTFTDGFDGDVAELAVYAAELSDADRHQVECSLGATYGIVVQGCARPCADLKAQGKTADGEYTITLPGTTATASIYCSNMAGDPVEYLTLAHTGNPTASGATVGANCFSHRAGGYVAGVDLTTCYDRIRLDVGTLLVDRNDFTYARSVGTNDSSKQQPYADAANCDWNGNNEGHGLVDLGGVPFAVADAVTFAPAGWAPYGDATISDDRKTVTFEGGGQCGDELPQDGLLYLKPAAP